MSIAIKEVKANSADCVRILHLSDLHFTSESSYKEGSFVHLNQRLVDAVNDFQSPQKPFELVFVTGDLADNSSLKRRDDAHRQTLVAAKEFLTEFCEKWCLNGTDGLVVIPGNHDYRWAGNISSPLSEKAFKEIFSEYFRHKIYKFQEMQLLVACFDSNFQHVTRRLEFARGYVDPNELSRFSDELANTKIKGHLFKAALVHHHPLPVGLSETEGEQTFFGRVFNLPKLTGAPEYMLLRNSGTFLHKLLEHDFRLVLHGHLHERGYWRALSRTHRRADKWIEVISGASVGRPDRASNFNFNIVQLFSDGYVDASQFGWSQEGRNESAIQLPATPYEVICDAEFEKAHSGVEFESDCYTQQWNVFLENGDVATNEVIQGMKAVGSARDSFFAQIGTEILTLSEFVAEVKKGEHVVTALPPEIIKSEKEGEREEYAYKIAFAPPLGRDPIELHTNYRFRGVCYSNRQDQIYCGMQKLNGWDEVRQIIIRPTKLLCIRLRFIPSPSRPWVPTELICEVTNSQGKRCDRERTSRRLFFDYWGPGRDSEKSAMPEAILIVNRPRLNYNYSIKWLLPDYPAQVPVTSRRSAFLGKLAADTRWRREGEDLAMSLLKLVKDYCVTHFKARDLADVSGYIFGFSESAATLICRATTGPQDDPLATVHIAYGRDVVGTAFRRCAPVFFRNAGGKYELFKNVPKKYVYLIAFPLKDPQDTGSAIGVFAVSTTNQASELHSLVNDEIHRDTLAGLIGETWVKEVPKFC